MGASGGSFFWVLSELFRLAWAGESMAGCRLVQILLGPRSSEVWGLRVRDIDADGMRLLVAAITKRHYIAPGADQAGNARDLAALLAPSETRKPAESPAKSDLLAALLALSPEDRRAILSAVGEKL